MFATEESLCSYYWTWDFVHIILWVVPQLCSLRTVQIDWNGLREGGNVVCKGCFSFCCFLCIIIVLSYSQTFLCLCGSVAFWCMLPIGAVRGIDWAGLGSTACTWSFWWWSLGPLLLWVFNLEFLIVLNVSQCLWKSSNSSTVCPWICLYLWFLLKVS